MHFIDCGIEHLDLILPLSRETFQDAYAEKTQPALMRSYLERAFGVQKIAVELANPYSKFFLLQDQNSSVGYLKVNFSEGQTEYHDPASLEIERLYVRQPRWGEGFGESLLLKAEEIARQNFLACIWLGVWQQNERAIAFYRKHGYEVTGTHTFYFEMQPHLDFKMEKRLTFPS
jgi:ribosomal protein S18 acetylase RimI-like enzyme